MDKTGVSKTSSPQPKDPLAATKKLILQMNSSEAMRKAMRDALKAMRYQPGGKAPGNS